MAAKDLDSGDSQTRVIEDITTCCICTDIFTDPKALPCIHTFCMKCLHSIGLNANKGPGDEMPCPICRRQFKIPSEGIQGLPKNFFIERLIQVAKVSDPSAASRALCSVCMEESKQETGKETPLADAYCVDCKHRLCEECCSDHRKFKLTKNHKLIPISEEHGIDKSAMADPVLSVCGLQVDLDVYCVDCKSVVGSSSFIDDHKSHEGSQVNKFVDRFRKQIEINVEAIDACGSQAKMKNAELLKVKEEMQQRVETLECDVANRKDEIKQLADKHAISLLEGLCSTRQNKLKDIKMATADLDEYLSCLGTYNSYCQEILAKGSASDICRAVSDLSARAVELQQQCQPMIAREIQSFNFCFRKSELEEFRDENRDNLIGEIEEEGDSKQRRRRKKSLMAEQSNEIDHRRKGIEIERIAKESLRLPVEELRVNVDNEMQANKALTEELSKEKDNYNAHITKLERELDENKATIITLQADNEKLVQEVKAFKASIKTLEDNAEGLKEELERRKTEKLQNEYKLDLVLVQKITTKTTENGYEFTSIRGLTILDNELFVVSEFSSEVEVYDSMKFSFRRRWNLKALMHPTDIGSCNRNKCLYIAHFKESYGRSSEIFRVNPDGKLITKWSIGEYYGCLSVTDESNVIFAVCFENKLNEYSPNGQLIREINLSGVGIRHLLHAIKLTNGHFLVSHGLDGDVHNVCVVDAAGKLKKLFGGECGSSNVRIENPIYLAVDGNGFVMVADSDNNRILILNSDLEFKKEFLSDEKHTLHHPHRIILDQTNGRLFVVNNGLNYGQILIFDLKA